jgi:hypothetical protein
MATVTIPPVVNDQGNINLHKDEGVRIPITVQDDLGAEIDATEIPLFFVCGPVRKALEQDENNPEGRVLVITPTNLTNIPHGTPFRVVDESNPDYPINKWEGRLFKRG